ncbi:MAG: phage integrase N-terminal SAM-like domain-containing protein, partial [Treponema sp.]|nr:phage integrase N-terminal SAM-like domain-containing protein [Treponema sp.]
MDVVFLFHRNDSIELPFFDSDPVLSQILARSKAGFWDYSRSCHVIPKKVMDAPALRRLFSGWPCVEFTPASDRPVKVSGFFDRPWPVSVPVPVQVPPSYTPDLPDAAAYPGRDPSRCNSGGHTPAAGPSVPALPARSDTTCLIEALDLPEKFSPVWAAKLESELRSRKYSLQTIRSYLHYNRYFCRRIQKCPEDAGPDDLRNYLAYLDKTLDLSTSSMNLAISAIRFFYSYVLKKDIAR